MKESILVVIWGMLCLVLPGSAWASMSHVMTDADAKLVYSDDFTSSYTTGWHTFTANYKATPVYSQTTSDGGYLSVSVTSTGGEYGYADFVSNDGISLASKKTEFVIAQMDNSTYALTRTLLINSQNPWSGSGFCIEHTEYNSSKKGIIKLWLIKNNGKQVLLYDSGNMTSYQYQYSISLIVDAVSGDWSFGWADGLTGVSNSVASGTLTTEQMGTYLSSSYYVLAGVYTAGSTPSGAQYDRIYGVDVYQVPEPSAMALVLTGLLGLLSRCRRECGRPLRRQRYCVRVNP